MDTITLSAEDLITMTRDDVFAAMGRPDLASDAVRSDAETVAARRRGTTSTVVSGDTSPGIVLISADHNPLA